jgi:hypothetical protein
MQDLTPQDQERRVTMLRLISLLAIAAVTAVVLLAPGSASAVAVNGCPPNFTLVPFTDAPPDQRPDHNADNLLCEKATAHGLLFIDNNIPFGVTPGVTDSGSTVVVDTETGDVVSP